MQPASAPPPPPARPANAPPRRGSARLVLGVIALLIAAFLAGYVPQRLQAKRVEETLKTVTLDLELAKLHRALGVAALEAARSNYSAAATSAADFFAGCATLAQREDFAGEPRTRVALSGYAQQRDAVMVQLAQADPLVAPRLAELYFTMEGVLGRRK